MVYKCMMKVARRSRESKVLRSRLHEALKGRLHVVHHMDEGKPIHDTVEKICHQIT